MAITAEKVRKFAELYAHHGKGAEQYRVAFDCPDMTPVDSGRRAWDLLQREDVKAIVAEIRAAARERAVISHAEHLNDLKNIRDLAIVAGKYAAAAQAEIARGKSAGLYVERTEVSGPNGTPLAMPTTIQIVAGPPAHDDGTDTPTP